MKTTVGLVVLMCLSLLGCEQSTTPPTPPSVAANRSASSRCANYADSVLALGSYQVPSYTQALVSGRNLYFLDYYGLQVFADNNPKKPHMVGAFPVTGFVRAAVQGDYLYLTQQHRGLLIIDISSPARPRLVSELPMNSPFEVFASGKTVFVGDNSELRSVDVSNPRAPRPIDSIDTRTGIFIYGFAAHGNYLYVARNEYYGDNEGSALIVDVANPADMREVGTFGWDFMVGPQVEGDYLGMLNYYPDAGSAFYLFDVSSGIPANPRRLNFNCGDFVIVGDYLYATEVPFVDYTGWASGPNRLLVVHLPDMTVVGMQDGEFVGTLRAGERLYSINWPLGASSPTMSVWPLQCR